MGRKKRRTREHVLADLSVNHVEGFIFRCGFSCERVEHDYGIDLLMFTYDEHGEIENGHVEIQIKATDRPKYREQGKTVACRITYADFQYWDGQPWPVILVLYDAQADRSYWFYIQQEFETAKRLGQVVFNGNELQEAATIRIPLEHRLDCAAIIRFRDYRDDVLKQVKGIIRHDY